MPAIVANAPNMLIDTDYPMDQVIYMTTGNASVPNGTLDTLGFSGITIAHGLPFTPLPILQWSNTSDFTITNENRDADYISNAFTTGAGQSYLVYSDSTNLYIIRYNLSGSTNTLYYRIFCFQPSDASDDSVVPTTANISSNFILNTDYNYLKLFQPNGAGILTTISNTFTHNLGYIPRIQIWEQTGNYCSRLVLAQDISNDPTGSGGATSGVHITTTQLVWLNPNTYDKIHYRIYLDE